MMDIRRSDMAIAVVAIAAALTAASIVHAWRQSRMTTTRLEKSATLVRDLGLTDLVLFTDARYTRHPSQADLHSAFQDHPLSLDHFPSGSLSAPPSDALADSGVSPIERETQP